jgi:hypothetical protein
VLSRLQSFDDLQASEFAATQVVPTARYPIWAPRAAMAFSSEQNAVRYLPAHRMLLAVRNGQLTAEVSHLLDLQPCWLLLDFHHLLLADLSGARLIH